MSDEIVKIEDISWDQVVNSFGEELDELTEKDQQACSYLVTGYSIPETAVEVGITAKTLRKRIKENEMMQKVISFKTKLVQEYLINEFRRQLKSSVDLSEDYLGLDAAEYEGNRDQIGLYKDQMKHARWVVDNFLKILTTSPLEGLSIINKGDGAVNVQFNLKQEKREAFDYISRKMGEADEEDFGGKETLLRSGGEPNFGVFGEMSISQEGKWVCHVCGEEITPGVPFFNHILKHGLSEKQYARVYNIIWSDH